MLTKVSTQHTFEKTGEEVVSQVLRTHQISRRAAIKSVASAATAGAAVMSTARPASAQSLADIDILNFALNLSYLQGQFFSYATTGASAGAPTGTGMMGDVTPGHKVALDAATMSIVAEIGSDTRSAASPMRVIIGALAIGQTRLDISGGASGPFTTVMRQAGVVPVDATFDPFGSEENFLYSAFYLKDVALSAYRGVLPSLTNRVVIQLFGGLIAAEAHHSATIRALLYARGAATSRMRANADKIAAFRRSLGGGQVGQGVSPATRTYSGLLGPTTVTLSNIAPADENGQVGGNTPSQTLNLLYLTRAAATQGGFFPLGVNGNLRTSASL